MNWLQSQWNDENLFLIQSKFKVWMLDKRLLKLMQIKFNLGIFVPYRHEHARYISVPVSKLQFKAWLKKKKTPFLFGLLASDY